MPRSGSGEFLLSVFIERQISPVRRTYPGKSPFTFGRDPTVLSEATWTCHDMHVFAIDNRNFNIAIKWRGIYRVPFHGAINYDGPTVSLIQISV